METPIQAWRFPPRAIALRLFLSCWLVYTLHFATNIVREIYPAVALGDGLSFRVDEYAGMHPDLFETPGYGWHIGNNPGASMVAAIPYAIARPVIAAVTTAVARQRAASAQNEPPSYSSPYPMDRAFYAEAWRRGFDVKLGSAAFVMQAFCMAPISALGVVAMFFLLRRLFRSDRSALWWSVLYAFGTPVFFRTGFLNHNMMIGHITFLGFLVLWNPGRSVRWSDATRCFLGGLAGGAAVLFDYSGVVFLGSLFAYAMVVHWESGGRQLIRHAGWYVAGTLVPGALLIFYQWQSFGHPIYPGQHWMPPVEWSELGYQGYGFPQIELVSALAFDYRFGLFASCPLMVAAFAAPFVDRRSRVIPVRELMFILLTFLALWLFFGGVSYTRLQFNAGIRYMAPILPFLFVAAAVALRRLPSVGLQLVAVAAVAQGWCLAMYRDVETGLGVLEPVLQIFTGGLRLPALTAISRLEILDGRYFEFGASPLPLFALTAVILAIVWQGSCPPEQPSPQRSTST